MKRVKPVYFHDQRGFLLTFGPQDDELYRWASRLSSERIRDIFAIHSFAEIARAAGGEGVREWMRARLRAAMRSATRQDAPIQEVPGRDGGWPARDQAAAPRIARLIDTYAPDSSRVLDPFAGSGLYPMIAAQRGADAFWCEISPVQRFLAVTRFRALYREDAERHELADELEKVAGSLPQQMERANSGADDGPGASLSSLRWFADRADWTDSGTARELFRAAVVSLLGDGEPLDAPAIANDLRRHAHHIASSAPMRTFPTLLADDARDLQGMRPLAADLLLTSLPFLGAPEAFPAAAGEFLSIDASAERRRAVASTAADVPRGRGTTLHRAHELRALERLAGPGQLRRVVDPLIAIVNSIDEPGKAALVANFFAGLIETLSAVQPHLASGALAIVHAPDSWFGGQLIRNADIVHNLFISFGFGEVASESKPLRVIPAEGVRKEDRVIVMRRGARPSAARAGWAAWA